MNVGNSIDILSCNWKRSVRAGRVCAFNGGRLNFCCSNHLIHVANQKLIAIAICVTFLLAAPIYGQQLETIEPLPPPNANVNQDAVLPGPNVNVPPPPAFYEQQIRIKDITIPEGDRENRIQGLGLVTGLSQTGGRAIQTQMMAQNYFQRIGLQLSQVPATQSMSAVIVSGAVPADARKGEVIQVNVHVADDAISLRGGNLSQTPLKGLDGQVYAIAGGQLLAGGIAVGGQAANVQRDHPTAGVCTAIIEREICADQIEDPGRLRLILRNKEYSTAVSIANEINARFGRIAQAIDQGTVDIVVPETFWYQRPAFLSLIGGITVKVDPRARVVINQKTGTIVMGEHVKILPTVVAKGGLVISTAENPGVSQPAPFSRGQTVVVPRTNLSVSETGGPYGQLGGTATVGELGRALNDLGVTPNMMIEMFTELQSVGALQAELIIK